MIEIKDRNDAIKAIISLNADKLAIIQMQTHDKTLKKRFDAIISLMDEIKEYETDEIKDILKRVVKCADTILKLFDMSDDELLKEVDEALNGEDSVKDDD